MAFTSTYYANYSHQRTIREINELLNNNNKGNIKEIFGNTTTVLALKQPPNLLRHITKASFSTNPCNINKASGLFKFACNDKRCNLCKWYIQEGKSFITSNGYEWIIKCNINCKSKNVLYYLKCNGCNEETYTGKTNDFRLRMNNHISGCRLGTSSDKFDNHVYECRSRNHLSSEAFF